MKHTRLFSIGIGFFVALFAAPAIANAAVMFPSPQDAHVVPDEVVSVAILLDSQGEPINVAGASIRYPRALLDVEVLSKESSIFTLWAEEPTVDRDQGVITFVGGMPNGSVVLNAPVLTIHFRAKTSGTARIFIEPEHTTVLKADGQGTLAQLSTRWSTVAIADPDPFLPKIFSETHPLEHAWSPVRDAVVFWESPKDRFVSFQMSKDPEALPDNIPETNTGYSSYPALSDGIWYFTLKEKVPGDSEWGPVVHRRIMIDGTPPEDFLPERGTEDTTKTTFFSFVTFDATSGVQRYEVLLERPKFSWFPFFPVGNWVAASSPVVFSENDRLAGVRVRAVDLAGNGRDVVLPGFSLQQRQQRFVIQLLTALVFIILLRGLWLMHHKRRTR